MPAKAPAFPPIPAESDAVPTPQLLEHKGDEYLLAGRRLLVVFIAMLLSVFLIALDQTILSTALPQIASDFDAFTLQGWVATAFVLTQTGFILVAVHLIRILPAKYVLLTSIVIFEVGSVVCGSSKGVYVLIVGRAITGLGAAGLFIGMMQIMTQSTKIEDRPRLFGCFRAVFGLSSVIGPLIGGAFTDKVSWRWCFYINLPVGGLSFVVVSVFLTAAPALGSDPTQQSLRVLLHQVVRIDWIGGLFSFAAITCITLALQWGGGVKPWSSGSVIAVRTYPFLPPDKSSGSVWCAIGYNFCVRFLQIIFIYYLPIYFQAARHDSAETSGIKLIPLMVASVVFTVSCGVLVSKFGRFRPLLIIGPVFSSIASGLMYTINQNTSEAKIAGYQILLGVGLGMVFQTAFFPIQTEFRDEPKLIGAATGMASFVQFFGATIGLGVAEAVFSSSLSRNLAKYAPTAPAGVIKSTPTNIYKSIPAALIPAVVKAYVKSLTPVFIIGVPLAIITFGLSFGIADANVRSKGAETGDDATVPGVAVKQEV